jgi:hypothetical protein
MTRATRAMVAAVLAVAPMAGCGPRTYVRWDQPPPGTVAVQVDSATAARNAILEPGLLGAVQSIPVKGWKGPGGQPFEVALRSAAAEGGIARTFGTITLPIALRTRAASISQYPCSSCHQGQKVVMKNKRIADAHQNIQPLHPAQTGAVCSTCHATDDVEVLTLKSGEHASLTESYRLCAQCHFAQVDAWAGGGHGKRLDGWQGRRVVMACTDCHDPHRPAVQERIPFRAPQLEKTRVIEQ